MRIIGIDPGIATTGFAIVEADNSKTQLLDFGVIETSKNDKIPFRLNVIFEKAYKLIRENIPCEIAIEKVFFAKNVKTAVVVSEARGVLLLAAAKNSAPVFGYTPLEVKRSITGSGVADKKQVQNMVQRILTLAEKPRSDDAADAIAIALTHFQIKRYNSLTGAL